MDTKKKIRVFFEKFIDGESVADEDNVFEKGLVNSLFAMQLVSFVEKEFDIAIDDDELDIENFKSIETLAGLVATKLLAG